MKIGLCGTISVGKTTLVRALSQVPEFKDYIIRVERSKYLKDLGIPLNTDSTLKGQIVFLAERATELFNKNIITDRTIIDVMAFTQSAKSINPMEKDDFYNLSSHLISEYDHIFYISPKGIKIEDNNVRETDPKYRDLIDQKIQFILRQYSHRIKNLHFIEGGSIEERVQKVIKACFL